MGLPEGRSDETWIDWNMFGHQVVTHLNPMLGPNGKVQHHLKAGESVSNLCIKLYQRGSKWIKVDQNGPKWIKLD